MKTAWLKGEAAGLVLLDREGKLVLVNETAGAWVRGGVLRIVDDQVVLGSQAEQRELDGAIRGVLRGDRVRTLEVSCSTPGQRLHTMVMPASRDWRFSPQQGPGLAALILFIRSPSALSDNSREGVLDTYGLTQAEARVALAAADGAMNNEIATKLRLSRNTIKTHLRRVYEKMGIRRQAELVRVLAG